MRARIRYVKLECLLVFIATLVFQISFISQSIFTPDEGIYALYAYRVLKGDLPYIDFYDNHTPGLYFLLALAFSIFGPSLEIARFFMYLINSLIALTVFVMVRRKRLFGAALSVLLLILGIPIYQATHLLADPAIALFSVLCVYLMILGFESQKPRLFLVSGIIASFSVLVRQSAIPLTIFLVAFLAWLWIKNRRAGKFLLDFLLGATASIGVFFTYLTITGSLVPFWDQAVIQNIRITARYLTFPPPPLSIESLSIIYVFLIPIFLGSALALAQLRSSTKEAMLLRLLALGSVLSTLMLAYPRFDLLRLYPSLALSLILMGVCIGDFKNLWKRSPRRIFVAFVMIGLILVPYVWKASESALTIERSNIDQDMLKVVEYIVQHTSQDDTIFAFPYRAEIYFLSKRMFPHGPGIVLPGVDEVEIIQRIRAVRLIVYNTEDTVAYTKNGHVVVEKMSEYAPRLHQFILEHFRPVKVYGDYIVYMA